MPPLTVPDYLELIKAAQTAHDLHELRAGALANESLHSSEKDQICKAIARQFARWNKAAVGDAKPRFA
ncbi:MAG: hypothetical protein ABSG59_22915 [Verrucomicrobiota bacterium]